MDLSCISVGSGGYYCPEHLATLGLVVEYIIECECEYVSIHRHEYPLVYFRATYCRAGSEATDLAAWASNLS